MNDIRYTLALPGDHRLVNALGGAAHARRALGMLADELLEGLMEDGDVGAREHVLGLAKRARAKKGESFRRTHASLAFDEDDPRFKVARREAFLAKRLAELLEVNDGEPLDPQELIDNVVSDLGEAP